MRAGSVRKSAGSAVALVALPLVAAPPYVASAMLPTRELYASTLARAAANMPRATTDLRPALLAQVAAELATLDAVAAELRTKISPTALVDKAAASARSYLQAIRNNKSPGPWSQDDVMSILNAPGTLLRRVPTGGPVVDDVPTGDAAPSSLPIGTIVGGVAGFAVGGPVGAVAGAAVGSFLGRRSA